MHKLTKPALFATTLLFAAKPALASGATPLKHPTGERKVPDSTFVRHDKRVPDSTFDRHSKQVPDSTFDRDHKQVPDSTFDRHDSAKKVPYPRIHFTPHKHDDRGPD